MNFFLILTVVIALSGCGGGSSTPTSITPVTPAPTVSITLSSPKVSVNGTVKISWSSTNATACTGSDGFSGTQPSSGSIDFKPNAGGRFKYTLSCKGTGGTGSNSQTLIVPIPVQRTSYLNAKNINIGPQLLPQGIGFVKNEGITAGFQFGDFFQDGTIAMAASSNIFNGSNGYGSVDAGRMYFFHTDEKGGWIDQTDKLLASTARTGCISPRKVIVADFNGDGKPDVFVACHGIDGNIPSGNQQGEKPRYLLSQADGTYKNMELPITCYCHGAAAVDFSGNGFAEVVVTDAVITHRPIYLKNNQDGTFTTTPMTGLANLYGKNAFSVEFVDIDSDGKIDLIFPGSEQSNAGSLGQPWDVQSIIFINDGSNVFTDHTQTVKIPTNTAYPFTNDVIVKDSKIAVLRGDSLGKLLVQVYSYPSFNVISMTLVPANDTVWFTLYNGDIVGSFVINPFTVKW